ncbi:helix-turn-helix transcriptional regulator [Bacillus cereus]|uniref:helix-turn-helix transcriptional regulator n=1 Tax=Bacillus cereus TaxID=1396 RepID=UPI000B4B0554|nr:helix-turn-helix transcriptional regulator [Bacillus cereus]
MANQNKTFDDIKIDALKKGPEKFSEIMALELFGKIMAIRYRKEISQRELSRLSGVAQKTISRLENGEDSPKLETILKLAAALGYTLQLAPIEETM